MRSKIPHALFAASLLAGSLLAPAPAPALEIDGDTVTHSVELAGIDVDVVIEFEEVENLTRKSIGLSVELLSDLDILLDIVPRLPDALVSVPTEFPILVKVQPPPHRALTFHGVAAVELHTHALGFDLGSALRLFAAPDGGDFEDITGHMGAGSYRARGTKGGFSEFLVVLDLRLLATVTELKFDALQGKLDEHAALIPAALLNSLQGIFDDARSSYDAADLDGAIDSVEHFGEVVVRHSGVDLDDTWTADGSLVNVAGELRAAADTLRFSLILESDGLLP